MQKAEAHVYFLDTIGMSDWFYGTTLNDVRYCVEGSGFFFDPSASPTYPAKVVLHFPECQGGDVTAGYAIYNYIRELAAKGVKTEARITGLCASIAVLCAIACDTVEMADAALLMVHKPTVDGCALNADDARAAAVLLDTIQAQLVGRYVARCGMDEATATTLINRTSWMGADEAMSYGFVTAKIADTPLVAPTGTEKVLNYYPATKPANPMALSEKEEKGLLAKIGNFLREEFGLKPKNETETPPPPAPTNTVTSLDVDGGDPLYFDGTELAEGTAVYSDADLSTAYADGDYPLADGRDLSVVAGVVDSLTDATADDTATNASADLAAANARIAELEAANTLVNRKLTAANNKLAKTVPGGGKNPTPPGSAQNMGGKHGTGADSSDRAAERSLMFRKK